MRHPRYGTVTACAAAVAVLAACSPPRAATARPAPPSSRTAGAAPGRGLHAARPVLSDRLVLTTTSVLAGTPIKGTLLVIYTGRKPINIDRPCGSHDTVVLTNRRFPDASEVPFLLDCSTSPVIIKPGENRLAVTVPTTYWQCSEVASQATSSSPACPPGHRMPPLPAGQYQAVLVGDSLAIPAPAPVRVVIYNGRSPDRS